MSLTAPFQFRLRQSGCVSLYHPHDDLNSTLGSENGASDGQADVETTLRTVPGGNVFTHVL
ncbi:MAG: hypothetical protein CM15mP88_1930 [Pseudomonadota bacterium]|nr:MAG: hypothetical protein CM15mP88_1930 [Pseudomonadota bacterium]